MWVPDVVEPTCSAQDCQEFFKLLLNKLEDVFKRSSDEVRWPRHCSAALQERSEKKITRTVKNAPYISEGTGSTQSTVSRHWSVVLTGGL
eukprot:1141694-Pelagomonas_calceolata.AAC.3